MEDIEEMSSVQESELATLRAKLDQRGPAPPGTEAKCVQLRSQVADLEDQLATLTRRFAALDHTQDEKRVALKASRAADNSQVDDLALELLQEILYSLHSEREVQERGQQAQRATEGFPQPSD